MPSSILNYKDSSPIELRLRILTHTIMYSTAAPRPRELLPSFDHDRTQEDVREQGGYMSLGREPKCRRVGQGG
jgi:hypothetical protein